MNIIISAILGLAHADESIAILNTQDDGEMANVEYLLNSTFRKSSLVFFDDTHFSTITKENMLQNIEDQDNLSCLGEAQCYVQVGQAIGADYIIFNEFSKIENEIYILTESYHTYSWTLISSENFQINEADYTKLSSDSFMADHFIKTFSAISEFSMNYNDVLDRKDGLNEPYLLAKYESFEIRKKEIIKQNKNFEEKLKDLKELEAQRLIVDKKLKETERKRQEKVKERKKEIDTLVGQIWEDEVFSNIRREKSEYSRMMLTEFIRHFYGVQIIIPIPGSHIDYSTSYTPDEVRLAALQLLGTKKVCFFDPNESNESKWMVYPSKKEKSCIPTMGDIRIANLSHYFTPQDWSEAVDAIKKQEAENNSFKWENRNYFENLTKQHKIKLVVVATSLVLFSTLMLADEYAKDNDIQIHSFRPVCWSKTDGDNYRYECL
jgi:hypothetical protein